VKNIHFRKATRKSLFVIGIGVTLNISAQSVTQTVNGITYTITQSTNSTFTSNQSTLQASPMWGNPSLAQTLATNIGRTSALGALNGGAGPAFAYSTGGAGVRFYMNVPGPGVINTDSVVTVNVYWALVSGGGGSSVSLANTQQSLVNTASVLQGTFTLQNTVMVNGFTYDCPVFDKNGVCISVGGRNTTVQTQGINNTNGLLIASYRLNQNNTRIGAWVDQNLSMSGPGTVQLNNSTPMIGLFGVWSQRPDGVGAEVKVSAAYGQKDLTVNRQIVGTSEAGSGGSQLISQGAQVVGKYGFAVMSDVVVSPYAGIRYTQNNMGGYTEASSSAVTAPLTYSALNTNATTVLAGAEARYRGIQKTTLFASAGVETDTNTSNGSYSATGVTGLTPVNFNPNPVTTRPTATLGGFYDITKSQRFGVTGIYRQEPFQAMSTTTVLATYTIGL
jgi:Autotransporter beta-domain